MAKKGAQRVYRDRQVTPDEAAADKKIREQIAAEFPPAQEVRTQSSSLSELLKRAIRDSGESTDEIARKSGVSPLLLERFLSGERDIHMTTADKLASALGLEVTAE